MINALKKQADSHYAPGLARSLAQVSAAQSAESALPLTADETAAKSALEKQARNLVGQTFYGTLLKQMRDSPFKSDLFSGGKGGQAFSGMYDQHLAERMAQRAGGRLTRPIIAKYKDAAKAAEQRKQDAKEKAREESGHVPHDSRA